MPATRKPSGGLEGTGVLVTGGGTGIGAACAAQAAADGAAVTICGRTEATLAAATERIEKLAANGGSIRYVVGDVTVEDDVARVVAAATEPTGTLDGVVANAGGGGGMSPYATSDTDEFRRVLELNAVGTFLCVKHALPGLQASKGSFVGMSSIAGHQTHRWFGAYTAGKGALEQIIRNAADEYGAVGVRFNAVRPGFITTEIMENVPRDGSVYNSYIVNTPMHGVGEPEDVADLVRFLLGAESRWITGQIINVDGGHSLRADDRRRRGEPAPAAGLISMSSTK